MTDKFLCPNCFPIQLLHNGYPTIMDKICGSKLSTLGGSTYLAKRLPLSWRVLLAVPLLFECSLLEIMRGREACSIACGIPKAVYECHSKLEACLWMILGGMISYTHSVAVIVTLVFSTGKQWPHIAILLAYPIPTRC